MWQPALGRYFPDLRRVGDYDNDGFLDLLIACGNVGVTTNLLYHNNGNTNAWLKVKLVGTCRTGRRSAPGPCQGHIHGRTMWQMREISGTTDTVEARGVLAHFGLGNATTVHLLRIEWPSGTCRNTKTSGRHHPNHHGSGVYHPANPSASLNGSVTLARTPLPAPLISGGSMT